jgi:alpha-beta hydrolase superfamily lysophospholipase
MKHTTYFLEDDKKRKIFYQQWLPDTQPKAMIAIVHGLGEHTGRYADFANYFTSNGFGILGIDTYGHGKTEGKKGHADSMEAYMTQIATLIEETKKMSQGKPIFLYGHSMGGNLVLNYLFRYKSDIQGLIASAPAVKPGFTPPAIKVLIGRIGKVIAPSFTQPNGLDLEGLSHDPAIKAAYVADPLVHNQLSGVVGIGILDWGQWLLKNAKKSSIPVLFIHGSDDKITCFESSKQLASQLEGDVTFKAFEGMKHEMHNEINKKDALDYLAKWVSKYLET